MLSVKCFVQTPKFIIMMQDIKKTSIHSKQRPNLMVKKQSHIREEHVGTHYPTTLKRICQFHNSRINSSYTFSIIMKTFSLNIVLNDKDKKYYCNYVKKLLLLLRIKLRNSKHKLTPIISYNCFCCFIKFLHVSSS